MNKQIIFEILGALGAEVVVVNSEATAQLCVVTV